MTKLSTHNAHPDTEAFGLERDEILRVEDLYVQFFTQEGVVRAVDGASFSVKRGQVLGIVGESGCGKSVTALAILRIIPPPGRIMGGKILYHRWRRRNGDEEAQVVDLTELPPRGREMRSIRGGEISMVFQEPMTSLDPVYTIGDQIMEAITLHQNVTRREARERAIEMLRRVGLPQPDQMVDSYPHQLSGGMRQRVMIAIALSCNPSLLIADEPTTALDVTTEAQILELMKGLQREMGTTIMLITHNLGVVAEMCDDVIVMYLGKVVEHADVDTIFFNPKHPYTQALLKSIPRIESTTKERLQPIRGIVPDPYAVPSGCPFWPRCDEFMPGLCDREEPAYITVEPDHEVRCHLYDTETEREVHAQSSAG
ncbi:MAG TPA: ABC transporter ATP-binding protein [Caldilineae bacterium]|nr:ABC transporter ATP-binding protein [Caldilineae bacterium]